MRIPILLSAALSVALAAAGATAQEQPLASKGKLDAVTVYRGQALVTRLVDVPGPAGLKEIVVSELPPQVLPGSIFAESVGKLEVRSVRYRVRPVEQDVRDEVRLLDDKIRELNDALSAAQRKQNLIGEQREYLNKLEQFAAPTANVELTKGVLNAQTLKDLTAFIFDERAKLVDQELALHKEVQKLQAAIDLAQRQRDEITNGSSRYVQEAVVFVNLQEAAGGQIHLRYLVNGATWTPSYNVRADAERKNVRVEYNASIVQTSGEDWTNVSMTLSTATPSLVARAPKLDPLAIALGPHEQTQAAVLAGKDYTAAKSELFNQLKQIEGQRGQNDFNNSSGVQVYANMPGGMAAGGGMPAQQPMAGPGMSFGITVNNSNEFDAVLNSVAGQLQVLDLVTESQDAAKKPNGQAPTEEGLSVTYALDGRTSLPSRSDRQLIQIASMSMKGDFYKVATPVLTNYVYEEATVANSSAMVLLAGPVSAFVAGQFVGTGDIPTVSVGETFTIGFGIDASLRASRELVQRDTKVQGGNRMVSFTYRIAVENFGPNPSLVRVYDRMPTADASQVKVTLVTPGGDLSNDPTFVNTQKKKGLLRWDLEAPPQTAGLAAKAIEYEFQVEYDKQYSVAGLPAKK